MNVSKNMHLDGYFQVFTFHRFLFIILRSDFLACVCVCVCVRLISSQKPGAGALG